MQIILEGVTGSTAYGLATENSDIDIHGIYQAPTKEVLGIVPIYDPHVESTFSPFKLYKDTARVTLEEGR